MSEKKEGEEIKGTLICGADGAVYFIPNQDLEAFRVPEEHAAPVREGLRQPAAKAEEVEGFWGQDYNASGIIIVGGVPARRVWAASTARRLTPPTDTRPGRGV